MRTPLALLKMGLTAALLLAFTGLCEATPFSNGGFETGLLSPWTILYPTANDSAGHTPADVISTSGLAAAHTGNYGVQVRNPGWNPSGGVIGVVGMISQDFDTVAGQSYWLSYWLKIVGSAGSDLGAVGWGDATAGCDWTTIVPNNETGTPCGVVAGSWVLDPVNNTDWTQYSFLVTAGSNLSTIVLAGRSDYSSVYFDDVTLTPTAAVPEPASVILLGTGLVAIATRPRRRGRR